MCKLHYFLSFTSQVLMPKGAYSGQKLMRLVNTKIPAKANKTMPKVPVMVSVKNKTPTIAAIINRITRSAVPIFFFMIKNFDFLHYCDTKNVQMQYLFGDYSHHSSKIFIPRALCSIFPSVSSFFSTLLTTSRAVPNSLAN